MKRKLISPLSDNELTVMSTRQLLARLKRLHQCEQSLESSDRDSNEMSLSDVIEFKESRQWQSAYQQLKELLAQREHLPRKKSRLHR